MPLPPVDGLSDANLTTADFQTNIANFLEYVRENMVNLKKSIYVHFPKLSDQLGHEESGAGSDYDGVSWGTTEAVSVTLAYTGDSAADDFEAVYYSENHFSEYRASYDNDFYFHADVHPYGHQKQGSAANNFHMNIGVGYYRATDNSGFRSVGVRFRNEGGGSSTGAIIEAYVSDGSNLETVQLFSGVTSNHAYVVEIDYKAGSQVDFRVKEIQQDAWGAVTNETTQTATISTNLPTGNFGQSIIDSHTGVLMQCEVRATQSLSPTDDYIMSLHSWKFYQEFS